MAEKKSKLMQVQNVIADDSFIYMGDSLDVLEIVNAIKKGYRLCKVDDVMMDLKYSEIEGYTLSADYCIKKIKKKCR